jgi:hypothetical protein
MAAHNWRGPPPRDAGSDPQNCRSLATVDGSEIIKSSPDLQQLPSRATLARRFPRLRLNRFTGAWRDDASGAKGNTIESLLKFIGEVTK